jgi:hypothetical protein
MADGRERTPCDLHRAWVRVHEIELVDDLAPLVLALEDTEHQPEELAPPFFVTRISLSMICARYVPGGSNAWGVVGALLVETQDVSKRAMVLSFLVGHSDWGMAAMNSAQPSGSVSGRP